MVMVKSMMSTCNLLEFLWRETLYIAAYVINRIPSRSILELSIELWISRNSKNEHFVFGVVQLR